MKLSDVRFLIQQYGIKPSKSKGQNFLVDGNILSKIVKAADLKKTDHVLEIGPGPGVLTEELVKKSKKVLAVELDKNLVTLLENRFKDVSNLEILQSDILKLKNIDLAKRLGSQKYKLVANIPYNITKPILRKFLTYDPKPSQIVILVQKEVARKIIAKDSKESVLSLSIKFYGEAEIIDFVSKTSFFPKPAVDSAILKIKILSNPQNVFGASFSKNFDEKKFWQLIKISFSSRRKQLHNNLCSGFKISDDQAKTRLKKAGLKPEIRAEKLSLADWALLYQQFMV